MSTKKRKRALHEAEARADREASSYVRKILDRIPKVGDRLETKDTRRRSP